MTLYDVTPRDFDILVRESRARGIDPRDVAIVLYLESGGFDPASAGPGGKGAVNGLNQMSVENLAAIGITPEAWRALSAADQLPSIFRWWDDAVRTFRPEGFPPTAADLGAMNFLPGRYKERGAATNPDAPLTAIPEEWYGKNLFYDPERTGAITVNTIRLRQQRGAHGARWQSLVSGIAIAESRLDGAFELLTTPIAEQSRSPRSARSGTAGMHLFFGAIVLVFGGVLARGGHR